MGDRWPAEILNLLPGSSSLYVIKTDTNGNKIWDWNDAGSTYEGYSIIETPDKGYVVVGSSNTTITNGIYSHET